MIFKMGDRAEAYKLGGKAFELVKLNEAGFKVPPFLVLTGENFFEFLGEEREELRSLLSEYKDENREGICAIIRDREFSADWKEEVISKVREYFGEDCLLAVRSSAMDEDGERFSFAGMMESYLNVRQGEEIFTAVKQCYLSCFSERAMSYRKENGLIDENIGMAVILQKMVEADASGVMFTSNPLTNNPDEVLISVVTGLGEALVSGEKNSFDAVYDRFGNRVEVDEAMPLSENILQEIVSLGLRVEVIDAKKRGRDIEFLVKDGTVYLLQNRLITSYSHIEKNKERTILDNSNIIESYSGVTTPLTFSFAREVYEKIYRQTLGNFFIDKEAVDSIAYDLENMIFFYENKIYYRLNGWYKMTALYPGYNKNKRYMENMMGVKVELKETKGEAKLRLFKIYFCFIKKLINMKRATTAFSNKFEAVTKDYRNNDFKGIDNKSLVKIYEDLEASILNDFTTPIVNDMGAMVFMGKVNEVLKKEKIEDAEGLLGKILSKQGNVESVKQSLALLQLVDEIWENEELAKAFRTKPVEELKLYLSYDTEFSAHLRDYILRFGARVMDELKLESITLKENPDFLFKTLKNYLQMEERPSVYKPHKIDEEELYRQVSFPKRFFLKKLVKITKYFVRNREFLRLYRTYIYDISPHRA